MSRTRKTRLCSSTQSQAKSLHPQSGVGTKSQNLKQGERASEHSPPHSMPDHLQRRDKERQKEKDRVRDRERKKETVRKEREKERDGDKGEEKLGLVWAFEILNPLSVRQQGHTS